MKFTILTSLTENRECIYKILLAQVKVNNSMKLQNREFYTSIAKTKLHNNKLVSSKQKPTLRKTRKNKRKISEREYNTKTV
jgi:hypothetical protein